MLFNSYAFVFVFLPLVFFVYFFLNKKRLSTLAKAFLVSASLFFYAYWNVYHLPILLGSIVFNFFVSKFLADFLCLLECLSSTDFARKYCF